MDLEEGEGLARLGAPSPERHPRVQLKKGLTPGVRSASEFIQGSQRAGARRDEGSQVLRGAGAAGRF